MEKKTKTSRDAGNWIGVGTAIGAAVFAATSEPVGIADRGAALFTGLREAERLKTLLPQ